MMDADKYNNDMELGQTEAKTVKEKKLPQGSLCSEYKDALDLYRIKNNLWILKMLF